MSDSLVISGMVLWLTLGIVACGAVEAATGVAGVGITVWAGGMVLATLAAVVFIIWDLASGAFRR